MRNEQEVLDEVKNWGIQEPNIRVALLTGSRANPDSNIDLFSDYDIEIVAKNHEQYLNSAEWLNVFGDPLAVLHIDEEYSMRMVTYKDYIRIDFRIYSPQSFDSCIQKGMLQQHYDAGYKILFDKDGMTRNMPQPTFQSFIIKKPTESKFSQIVFDFWWDITYVAKSLWRDELFYAKYMMDHVIRFSYLQKMIEWYVAMQNNWQVSTNKHGRFFKRYLDTVTWKELEITFSGYEIDENWKALLATSKLFRKLATSVAKELNYAYPDSIDSQIMKYVETIKNLDRNAVII